MENLGYYNGKFGPLVEMQVPMLDRVCFFGDGCYDATYSRTHVSYALDEHLERFYNSAALLGIRLTQTKAEMGALLTEMVKKVDCGEQFVYWQVTRGTAMRNHAYPDPDKVPANLWIVLTPCSVQDTYKKINLITTEDTRFLHCNIKPLNQLPSSMVAQRPAGYLLAVLNACAVLGQQPTAGRVREARHRAEYCPVGQGNISDLKRFHLIPRFA